MTQVAFSLAFFPHRCCGFARRRSSLIFSFDRLGHDGDEEKEKSNSHHAHHQHNNRLSTRKPLMQSLTNAESNPRSPHEADGDGDDSSQRTSYWRRSRVMANRVKSVDPSENGAIDPSDVHSTTAAAPSSSHRFRSHNAFNRFVQQTIDFARRTSKTERRKAQHFDLFDRTTKIFSSDLDGPALTEPKVYDDEDGRGLRDGHRWRRIARVRRRKDENKTKRRFLLMQIRINRRTEDKSEK